MNQPNPSMTDTTDRHPCRPSVEVQDNAAVVLSGSWNLRGLAVEGLSRLRARLDALAADPDRYWDLQAIDSLDHVGALILWQAWGESLPPNLRLRAEHEPLFGHWQDSEDLLPPAESRWRFPNIPRKVTELVSALLDHVYTGISLLGQLVLDTIYLVRHPAHIPWQEISATIYLTGARALSVTALVGLLIGVVVSYLSAVQLQFYGVQNYIVNILGLSIIRELGPLLTAILVAGRSGSAITAQLGVMRLARELDALAALGISHTLRLVLPKVVALVIVMPLLVVWTDAIALFGGMTSARLTIGIGYYQFLTDLPDAVPIANFWIGLVKGVVFGGVVALTACHFGLRILPNTQSLGNETTNSVVASIALVILMDAIFAVLFQGVGMR